jgi:hypothetical protein
MILIANAIILQEQMKLSQELWNTEIQLSPNYDDL